MTGEQKAPAGHHTNKSNAASFGLPKGAAKPDASTFRLKNTGTFKLPEGKNSLTFYDLILKPIKSITITTCIVVGAQIFGMSNLS